MEKNRDGKKNFGAVLSQNYLHGQFVHASAPLERNNYEQMLEALSEKLASRRRAKVERNPSASGFRMSEMRSL